MKRARPKRLLFTPWDASARSHKTVSAISPSRQTKSPPKSPTTPAPASRVRFHTGWVEKCQGSVITIMPMILVEKETSVLTSAAESTSGGAAVYASSLKSCFHFRAVTSGRFFGDRSGALSALAGRDWRRDRCGSV
jgi:hypothetical protein